MASREQQAGLQPPAQSDQAQGSACQVCGKAAAKYCCPRCDRRTCSLDCVKAHKEATGCSGKRDRTAFVGRGAFDERTFLSDYRFLEEVKLADDVAKRSKPPAPKPELPQFLQTLQYQARRRVCCSGAAETTSTAALLAAPPRTHETAAAEVCHASRVPAVASRCCCNPVLLAA
jgi:hypothetical protein